MPLKPTVSGHALAVFIAAMETSFRSFVPRGNYKLISKGRGGSSGGNAQCDYGVCGFGNGAISYVQQLAAATCRNTN